jgi:hypothetical protein
VQTTRANNSCEVIRWTLSVLTTESTYIQRGKFEKFMNAATDIRKS